MPKMKVKDIMTKDVITAKKDTTFLEIAILMKRNDIGFIPIVEDNTVIGVITDRDIVIRGISNKENHNTMVGKYITQKVISVESSILIDEASDLMAKKQIKRLVVIDNDKLVGVLSLADITNCNNKKALEALTGINKRNKKVYFEDNPKVDDFKL